MPEAKPSPPQFLLHWRGEKGLGYSKPFRQLEFTAAFHAESDEAIPLEFVDALNFTGKIPKSSSLEDYNESMQYLRFPTLSDADVSQLQSTLIRAAERCSLVHALHQILARSNQMNEKGLAELCQQALDHRVLENMYPGGERQNETWCLRARSFHPDTMPDTKHESRYGHKKKHSLRLERQAIQGLLPLMKELKGPVDLTNAQCTLYMLDGLVDFPRVLVRQLATGPKTSVIAPVTRVCITSTPLCPLASFALCNAAQITNSSKVLDPYAGSCTTLLAASMIAPDCQSVGIDVAEDYIINRDHIQQDFLQRNLTLPKRVIHGDFYQPEIRTMARQAIVDQPFDVILTDPPYGIRETTVRYTDKSPLEELFVAIAEDRESGHRLLAKGGRFVAFCPVHEDSTLERSLPPRDLTERAGLVLEDCKEQVLNDHWSRWLVSFVCQR
eukprot:Nitzschia sp. Nitz4//scaffold20_size174350//138500//139891//NITZ4_002123-RA/size174350-snap-gene-0.252-mRNA-1//-1//CDS//3329541872//1066//frame0